MIGYRMYFVDENGSIQAREEFFATDDDVALGVAAAVCHACSDTCHSYELWQGGRQVLAYDGSRGEGRVTPTDQQTNAIQLITLNLEETLQRDHWRIARSEKLIAEAQRLKEKINVSRI